MPNESEYNRRYYEKHRELLNQKRRKKYLTDPEFAERQRARSRQAMKRMREARKEARKNGVSTRRQSGPRMYEVTINGEKREVRMYHIGALAQLLGRRVKTLYTWEKKGVLPKAMFRDTAKRRMYTEDQVVGLVEAFNEVVSNATGHKWLPEVLAAFREVWSSMPQGVKEENGVR